MTVLLSLAALWAVACVLILSGSRPDREPLLVAGAVLLLAGPVGAALAASRLLQPVI